MTPEKSKVLFAVTWFLLLFISVTAHNAWTYGNQLIQAGAYIHYTNSSFDSLKYYSDVYHCFSVARYHDCLLNSARNLHHDWMFYNNYTEAIVITCSRLRTPTM